MLSMSSVAKLVVQCMGLTSAVLCLLFCGVCCRSIGDGDTFLRDCRAWCRFDMVCDGGPDNTAVCVDACEDSLELDVPRHGVECEPAFREAMACIAEMDCDEYRLFQNVPVEQGPCPEVLAPYYELCPGVFLAADRPET